MRRFLNFNQQVIIKINNSLNMQQISIGKSIFKGEYLVTETENWENWRTKSLNSGSLQRYSLPISPKPTSASTNQKKIPEQDTSTVKHTPKIIKINENMFCVLLNNTLTIFSYLDENERERKKVKSRFIKILIEDTRLPRDIEWVFGDGSSRIYVGSEKQIVVLSVKGNAGKQIEDISEVFRKQINNIKALKTMVSNLKKYLIVLTKQSVLLFNVNRNYQLIKQLPITFSTQSSGWSDLSKINGISLLASSLGVYYFFGTSIQLKADVRHKLGREEDKNEPVRKKCEALYLTKIQLNEKGAEARVFIIDHIFEIGIFKKSRVHQVGNQTFLLSLYQEIIVIRRNFSKFMVWDNVSIASSKSNQKKGQLVLADKRIMVYTQNSQISAYELFFNFEKAKLETPKIDSFKGNSNEQEVLYEALILQYKQKTYMKVLFYFKQMEVYIPNRKAVASSQQSTHHPAAKNELFFQVMCIQQTEPTQKLKEFLEKNRTEEIQSFLKRFHISELTYKKSQWEVSAKGEKQIEALLLNIKDNEYIQSELTKILKAKPHDLLFLIAIQKKQIERYRTMIASKLLLFEQHQTNLKAGNQENVFVNKLSEFFLLRELDEVKLAIQWLLQSKMFYKKLQYSLSFMSFKEYDFIDIGKLRAASLREEIKLLGVKGYQKRLKYFFNSFKYLVLDDFKEIIKFVISDLSQYELRSFFSKSFPFILPSYQQPEAEDRCKLWDDTFNQDELQIETINLFCKQVEQEMSKLATTVPGMFLRIPLNKAVEAFNQLFVQFRNSSWFIQNSYKQHSLLHHNIQQLKSMFFDLKRVEVFNMIIQFAYEKIQQNKYNEKKVKEVIASLKKDNYFSQDYVFNLEARLEVYEFILLKIKIDKKKYIGLSLPEKPKFIIMKESELFQLLFQNFAEHLVNIIKDIYETKKVGLFLENLKKFLYSPLPKLESLIQFMSNFRQNENPEVRKQFFQCIYKMMKITDAKNSSNLINKIANMPVLQKSTKQKLNTQKLVAEAKVCYANYFSPLFNKFNLSYTYAQLLSQTECSSLAEAEIFGKLISAFIEQYNAHPHTEDIIEFNKSNIINQLISNVDLCQIIDFLSILLYFHDMMGFCFENVTIFNSFVVGFVETGKFEHISEMMEEILEFGKLFDDRDLIEKFGNYRVFNQFKIQTNIKKEFQLSIMNWIDQKYQWLVSLKYQPIPKEQKEFVENLNEGKIQEKLRNVRQSEDLTAQVLKQTFFSISSALKILNFYSSGEKIQSQISRVSLLSTIKLVSPNLLCLLLPTLILQKEKYKNMSSFTFMTSLLHKINSPSKANDTSATIDNRQIFAVTRRQDILQLLSGFNKVHKEYVNVFQAGKKKNEDMILGELCRFNVEFVVELIGWGYPRVAGFVLLDLINSSYYYRDVLFFYLARMADSKKVSKKELTKIVYEFLAIDNPQDLKKILNAFIVDHHLAELAPPSDVSGNIRHIFTEILSNNQLDQAFFFSMRNVEVDIGQLEAIALSMNKFREDHVLAQGLVASYIRTVKQRVEGQNWPTFMLYKRKINCMMRPLERMEIIKDISIMLGQLEIGELRKKIKEMESAKYEKQPKTQSKNQQNESSFKKLRNQYEKYMRIQNLNPWLTINSDQIEVTAIRLQKYPEYSAEERKSKDQYYKILPIIREEESSQVKELRKKLFQNQQKLKEIQESNRQLMEEQIVPAITQVKLTAEREHMSLIQRKKKKKQEQQRQKQKQKQRIIHKQNEQQAQIVAGRKQGERTQTQKSANVIKEEQQLQKLQEEEKEKVGQLKKNYSSKIIQETESLINELRERRKKIKQQTAVTFASEDERKKVEESVVSKGSRPSIGRLDRSVFGNMDGLIQGPTSPLLSPLALKDKTKSIEGDGRRSTINARDELKQKLDILRDSHLKGTTINRLIADKNGQFYVPRWEQKNPMRVQFEEMLQEKPKKSQFLQKVKKEMVEQNQKQRKEKAQKDVAKKITAQDLVRKYKQLNQPEASQMVEKLSVVLNNPKACTEILKNLYLQMKELKNFIQFCKDLLLFSEATREFIQQKSVKIVQQSLKTKVTIPTKQIFPPHFFTTIYSTALRDYYHIAYNMIRPNLLKLMQQPNYNVNSLAMMIRFGFGSDTSFYYRVYEDYIQSMLQSYESKSGLVFAEKDLMQLAQKLRTNYNNLNPSNKKNKFEELVQDVKSVEKRKALIRALLVNLENKSTMVNRQAYEDFRIVLVKLEEANSQLL